MLSPNIQTLLLMKFDEIIDHEYFEHPFYPFRYSHVQHNTCSTQDRTTS